MPQPFYNRLMSALLRSPLHGLISANIMLITVTGRRSGSMYAVPVNYLRDGTALIVMTQADRTWWRNLRGGAPVSVRLQGREYSAHAEALESAGEVAAALVTVARLRPAYARYLGIDLDAGGQPTDLSAAQRAAQGRVIVRVSDLQRKR